MDGRAPVRAGGWASGWVCVHVGGWADGRARRKSDRCAYGQVGGWAQEQAGGWTGERVGEWVDGRAGMWESVCEGRRTDVQERAYIP